MSVFSPFRPSRGLTVARVAGSGAAERQDGCFRYPPDKIDGVAGQRDAEDDLLVIVVEADLQPQCFEQPPGDVVGQF